MASLKNKKMPRAGSKQFSNAFSLTDEIAGIIRDRILKGEYAIGEKIIENQIATELRVSRTPIREAFKQLEEEGLMEYVPNRGCFARGFTKQDMGDIYAVREALEQLAVSWAIERISEEDIQKLHDECELMEFYSERRDKAKILETNAVFHEIIYNSTQSRFLAQILRSYQDYVEQARRVTVSSDDFLEEILNEHKSIYEAIKNRDEETARRCVVEHMERSKNRTEEKWGIK